MKIHVNFKGTAYPWSNLGSIYVRGYALYCGQKLERENLAKLFAQKNAEQIACVLQELDGLFSIAVVNEESVLLISDRVRCFPLFYWKENDIWHISDYISSKDRHNYIINNDAFQQMTFALMTFGKNTLCDGVYQIECGQMVELKETTEEPEFRYWWEYKYATKQLNNYDEIFKLLKTTYDATFTGLIKLLGRRMVAIPLSGGHDSRLIAFYLKEMGCDNIVAFSYGKHNNEESALAGDVAKYLGIPFNFIEHEYKKVRTWAKEYLHQYMDFAGNASSVPCPQEAYAVYTLKKLNLIADDAVFVPGYSGDFLAGSHLYSSFFEKDAYSFDDLKLAIARRHLTGNNKVRDESLRQTIGYLDKVDYLIERPWISCNEFAELYERFDMLERQAKFIVNAVRTYEFYGHEWLLPEFDINQFNAWLSIDPKLRVNRDAYFKFEKQLYPREFKNIPFAGECHSNLFNRVLDRVSRYSPFPWNRSAHYLFSMASIRDYMNCRYKEKYLNLDHWLYKQYIHLWDN